MKTNFAQAAKQHWYLEDLEQGELFAAPSYPCRLFMKTDESEMGQVKVVVVDSFASEPDDDSFKPGALIDMSNGTNVTRYEQATTLLVTVT